MKSYTSLREDLLKNAEIKKAYDELGPEFSVIEELIAQRLKQGISQGELAEKIGTRQSAISRFESGSYNPTVQFLYKIADALNVNLVFKVSAIH